MATHWELARAIEADRLLRQKDHGFKDFTDAVGFTRRAYVIHMLIGSGLITDRVPPADSSSSSERSER